MRLRHCLRKSFAKFRSEPAAYDIVRPVIQSAARKGRSMGNFFRCALLFSIGILLFASSRSEAQQPTRVPRVGILIPEAGLDESQTVKGFKEGLKKAGYN